MIASISFFSFTFTFWTILYDILFDIFREFNIHGLFTAFAFMPFMVASGTEFHAALAFTVIFVRNYCNVLFAIGANAKFYIWITFKYEFFLKTFVFLENLLRYQNLDTSFSEIFFAVLLKTGDVVDLFFEWYKKNYLSLQDHTAQIYFNTFFTRFMRTPRVHIALVSKFFFLTDLALKRNFDNNFIIIFKSLEFLC